MNSSLKNIFFATLGLLLFFGGCKYVLGFMVKDEDSSVERLTEEKKKIYQDKAFQSGVNQIMDFKEAGSATLTESDSPEFQADPQGDNIEEGEDPEDVDMDPNSVLFRKHTVATRKSILTDQRNEEIEILNNEIEEDQVNLGSNGNSLTPEDRRILEEGIVQKQERLKYLINNPEEE